MENITGQPTGMGNSNGHAGGNGHSKEPCPSAEGPDLFQDLLKQLGDEHRSLKEENARLRKSIAEAMPMPLAKSEATSEPDGVRSPVSAISLVADPFNAQSMEPQLFQVSDQWKGRGARTTDRVQLQLRQEQVASLTSKYVRRGDTFSELMISGIEPSAKPPCIINPSSSFRMWWDFMGLILISYDMITIPMQVFEQDPNVFTDIMDMLTLIFWTIDLGQSFFVGYYSKGNLIMGHCKIVKNYLRSWFIVDICVVAPDWVIMATSTNGGEGDLVGLGRTLRATRAMRVLRLLRLLKLKRIINAVYDMIDSEYMFILLSLVRLLLFILILNHLLACGWYGVGLIGTVSEGHRSWIYSSGVFPVFETDLGWKYTTCLHWSLTQFTPASMDVSAITTVERIYSIIVLFFAMVAFSSIVASITASMTTLRNIKGDEMKQFWLLRRYFKQRNISKELSEKILKFLEYKESVRQKQVQRGNIKILNELSAPLGNELNNEMYYQFIGEHPLFAYMRSRTMRLFLYRVCDKAVSSVGYAEQDTVFEKGDDGRKMYFVSSGFFTYCLGDGCEDIRISKGDWISEASLWTTWEHRGKLSAVEAKAADLIEVDPQKLCEAVQIHPKPWKLVTSYASTFVMTMNEKPQEGLTDLLDFDADFEWPVEPEDSEESRRTPRPSISGLFSNDGKSKLGSPHDARKGSRGLTDTVAHGQLESFSEAGATNEVEGIKQI